MFFRLTALFLIFLLGVSSSAIAAPKSELLPLWNSSNESNSQTIDHSKWQSVLDSFVVKNASGINKVNYAKLKSESTLLNEYVDSLLAIDPRAYNKGEQFSYWVNLYNAATVQLVTKEYPVRSITKIKSGVFSFGPWDKKWITVAGETLSLNDIEHGILRPVWNESRIHFIVNCASIGCPNLSKTAFTTSNAEEQMERLAKDYINHPRGVSVSNGKLTVSSIFDWYLVDFGNSADALLNYLKKYANDDLKTQLNGLSSSKFDDNYDWSLNSTN